jgi:predicted CXXCH cytochrome family protein
MYRRGSPILAVLAIMLVTTGTAYAQKSAMVGGDHDVRVAGTTGDLCSACHTPHNANASFQALLWNRSLPAATSFQVYDSTVNPDFKGGAVSLAGGTQVSLLCLSCHDGTTALNTVLQPAPGTSLMTSKITGSSLLGTDLRNDHPVAFSYDAAATAPGAKLVANPDITKVKLFGATGSRRVECGSCHDAHSTAAAFLRTPNTNSQLCLACHT